MRGEKKQFYVQLSYGRTHRCGAMRSTLIYLLTSCYAILPLPELKVNLTVGHAAPSCLEVEAKASIADKE